ncbi:tol-pal system YbgF family protein [Methanobrevibacter sp.]|uniref:tetratricopeptide repeat protein n=1 Tax=Methanobrevibacter sp. TaxID=66852 RepID=UPI0026DF19B4|nr:hypothetical protein [Methanobrevibacter sp.]MDO5859884.1 hypothetical protein [Methanobrevibacter sp.]
MPVCPTCGAYVEDGVETCSCGTTFIVSEEEKLQNKYREEELKIDKYREFEAVAIEAFEDCDYEKALDYSTRALDLNLGSDAEMKFIKGKSLFNLKRFYDSILCFDDYIMEYKDSFYRFSNIPGAYVWKARCQWQLGNGFGSIKSYYKALEFTDKRNVSNDEKNRARLKIRDERQSVINDTASHGISNPRFGILEYDVFDIIEKISPNLDLIMQNLYDAIDELEDENHTFDSFVAKDDVLFVRFTGAEDLEKRFDGSNSLID